MQTICTSTFKKLCNSDKYLDPLAFQLWGSYLHHESRFWSETIFCIHICKEKVEKRKQKSLKDSLCTFLKNCAILGLQHSISSSVFGLIFAPRIEILKWDNFLNICIETQLWKLLLMKLSELALYNNIQHKIIFPFVMRY